MVTSASTADSSPIPRLRGSGYGVRVLMLGWSLWLLGTWLVLWVVGGWTMPALRLMVFAGLVGMMGGWPAVRLSQPTRTRRGAAAPGELTAGEWARACRLALVDWLALNLVFQAVIWPLQLAARWSPVQTLWLDAALAGWSLLTALLIAWGRGTNRPWHRQLAMLTCVGVVVVEPALLWLNPDAGVAMRVSPLRALWQLSSPAWTAGSPPPGSAAAVFQILGVTAAAAVGWAVLWGLLALQALREDRTRG